MNPQEPPFQASPTPPPPREVHNPLEVMQPGEKIICEIRRHPAGMLGLYLAAGTILVILAVLLLVVTPNLFAASRGSATAIGITLFLLIACVIVGFVFIANKIYWGNNWVVSSDSLTQISQSSLLNKQSSQLSLSNLEDVTSKQHGLLSQLFKYGTLSVETAGERSKFTFPYCPNPNYYAQKILAAREAFERLNRAKAKQPPQHQPHQPDHQPAQTYQVPPAAPQAPRFSDAPYDSRQNDHYS